MSHQKITASSLAQGISLFNKKDYAMAIAVAVVLILVQGWAGVATAIAILGTAVYLRKKASDDLEKAVTIITNVNFARYAGKHDVDRRLAVIKRRLARLEAGKTFGHLKDPEYFVRNTASYLECDEFAFGYSIVIWSFPDRGALVYEDSELIRKFLGDKNYEFLDRLDQPHPYVAFMARLDTFRLNLVNSTVDRQGLRGVLTSWSAGNGDPWAWYSANVPTSPATP